SASHTGESADDEERRESRHDPVAVHPDRAVTKERHRCDVREEQQSARPEDRADDELRAQRTESHQRSPSSREWMRYPSPRTVSMSDAPSLRRSRATKTSTVFESRSKSCE